MNSDSLLNAVNMIINDFWSQSFLPCFVFKKVFLALDEGHSSQYFFFDGTVANETYCTFAHARKKTKAPKIGEKYDASVMFWYFGPFDMFETLSANGHFKKYQSGEPQSIGFLLLTNEWHVYSTLHNRNNDCSLQIQGIYHQVAQSISLNNIR